MKNFLTFIILVLSICTLMAQNKNTPGGVRQELEVVSGQNGEASPEEPAFVVNGIARIIMNNGEKHVGMAKYSFVQSNNIYLTKPGQKRKRIKTRDVKEFYINEYHFVNIKTSLTGGSETAILKTPAGAKISIYEIITQPSDFQLRDGKKYFITHRSFYVLFPHQITPFDINDLSFSFDKKVSKLVEDCPVLSEKIANRHSDYKVTQVTPPCRKLEVLQRISQE
jgi:hypothetical protein